MYFLFDPPSLRRQTSYKVSNLCLLNSKSFWMGLKTVLFKNDKTIFVQICQAKQTEQSSPSPGGGPGFFLTCKDFGRMFDNSFSAWTFF